jgi:hypothetical protein
MLFMGVATAFAVHSAPAAPNLIVNGSFETPVTSSFVVFGPGSEPAGFGFTATSGTVEVDNTQQAYGNPAFAGNQNLDLDGTSAGALQQTFATIPGQTYDLTFAYSNHVNAVSTSAAVSVMDSASQVELSTTVTHSGASRAGGLNWTVFNQNFVADTAASTLSFSSLDAANSTNGMLLDAVSVTAVPEPLSLAACVCGALLLTARRPQRRKIRSGRGRNRQFTLVPSAGALLAIGLLAMGANSVQAQTTITVYQSGFESPTYSLGALNGQDGWFNMPSQATVENTTVFAGGQAAGFNATGLTGQTLGGHSLTYDPTGLRFVDVTGEFFLSPTGTPTNWDVADFVGKSGGFIDQLVVVNSSVAELGTNVFLGNVPVSKGVWNSFEMTFDYTTDIKSAYVNGTFVGQGGMGPDPIALYAFGVNSAPGTDSMFLDNINVTVTVPEPSSAVIGLALLGGLVIVPVLRRRKAFHAAP